MAKFYLNDSQNNGTYIQHINTRVKNIVHEYCPVRKL